MESPRPLRADELGDFVQFLSTQLRPQMDWRIDQEYPHAIHEQNLQNVRVIRGPADFLSAAVMKPLVIKSPAGLFKAAAIGSVVTHPSARNQGLSGQVLKAALEAGREEGCDFAILWTNLYDFYRRLGFELAGTEVALKLPHHLSYDPPPGPLRFVEGPQIDPEALLRLYSRHTTGSIRTVEDVRKFLRIPNARVLTAWDAQNRLQAYAVEGKGADLGGYIHEWGGGVSKILPLLSQLSSQNPGRDFTLIAPVHAQNLIMRLEQAGATRRNGALGMIKLLNPDRLLMKTNRYARALGANGVEISSHGGVHTFRADGDTFTSDSDTDLVRVIFGPSRASEIRGLNGPAAAALERVFPIPMWVWGWDSV